MPLPAPRAPIHSPELGGKFGRWQTAAPVSLPGLPAILHPGEEPREHEAVAQ